MTQIPSHVEVSINGNSFGHTCDCNIYKRIELITGYSNLSSPFIDLTSVLTNTSQCRLNKQQSPCFPRSSHAPVHDYLQLFCVPGQLLPSCARDLVSDEDDLNTSITTTDVPDGLSTFYDDFLLLFQVKTTKGILLFLLFCVLCSVITVAICVGFIWVHRYVKLSVIVCSVVDNISTICSQIFIRQKVSLFIFQPSYLTMAMSAVSATRVSVHIWKVFAANIKIQKINSNPNTIPVIIGLDHE